MVQGNLIEGGGTEGKGGGKCVRGKGRGGGAVNHGGRRVETVGGYGGNLGHTQIIEGNGGVVVGAVILVDQDHVDPVGVGVVLRGVNGGPGDGVGA